MMYFWCGLWLISTTYFFLVLCYEGYSIKLKDSFMFPRAIVFLACFMWPALVCLRVLDINIFNNREQ
jgi:hypothetical protein